MLWRASAKLVVCKQDRRRRPRLPCSSPCKGKGEGEGKGGKREGRDQHRIRNGTAGLQRPRKGQHHRFLSPFFVTQSLASHLYRSEGHELSVQLVIAQGDANANAPAAAAVADDADDADGRELL